MRLRLRYLLLGIVVVAMLLAWAAERERLATQRRLALCLEQERFHTAWATDTRVDPVRSVWRYRQFLADYREALRRSDRYLIGTAQARMRAAKDSAHFQAAKLSWHVSLREKYRAASKRPWRPIAPDPAEPVHTSTDFRDRRAFAASIDQQWLAPIVRLIDDTAQPAPDTIIAHDQGGRP